MLEMARGFCCTDDMLGVANIVRRSARPGINGSLRSGESSPNSPRIDYNTPAGEFSILAFHVLNNVIVKAIAWKMALGACRVKRLRPAKIERLCLRRASRHVIGHLLHE